MRQIKTILVFLLCVSALLPFCLQGKTELTEAAAADHTVRIGIAVPESGTTLRTAYLGCDAGFVIGRSNGEEFSSRFELAEKAIVVIPDRNYKVKCDAENASGRATDEGNFFAYHILVKSGFSDFVSAKTAASAYADGFVGWDGKSFDVRRGSYPTKEQAAEHGTPTEPIPYGLAVIDAANSKLLFEYACGDGFALKGKGGSDVMTYCNSDSAKPYPGFFEISCETNMRIINVLDLETYVKCVMSNEIGTNQTRETRKAFSVLARTVPFESKHGVHGYDVCACSCCQVYFGNYRRDKENDAIVDSTKGEVVTYKGQPIHCLYHNSNGGTSCSSVAAWGGEEIPYLVSVTLPEDENNQSAVWQRVFSKEEFNDYLHARSSFSALTGEIDKVSIESTDPYGSDYVTLLSITDANGNELRLENAMPIRNALGIQSGNFTVTYTMDATVVNADGSVTKEKAAGYLDADGCYHAFDSFSETFAIAETGKTATADTLTLDGLGTGHGVGFSSNGSEQLAKEGFSYKYILGFYYPGTKLDKLY